MKRFPATVRFDSAIHRAEKFSSGAASLDRWLVAYAGQGQRRDAARTFVSAAMDGRVHGYYTLVAAQIEHARAGIAVRRGMSRHFPIPVALIARLAVDQRDQGRGLGRSLLLDALRRVVVASEQMAVRAVLVEAIDDRATAFYQHFGFESSEIEPALLMVEIGAVRRIVGSGR